MTTDLDQGAQAAREIFAHAIRLFEVQGFHRTSMSQLAAACGVTKPTLYYYFENKSHLLEALYQEVTKGFYNQLRALSGSTAPASDRLRRFIEMQVTYSTSYGRFLTVFWRERHELDESARKRLAQSEREFERLVQNILETGTGDASFRPCEIKVVAYSILGMLSTVHRWTTYVAKTPAEIADQIVSMVLNGVLSNHSDFPIDQPITIDPIAINDNNDPDSPFTDET